MRVAKESRVEESETERINHHINGRKKREGRRRYLKVDEVNIGGLEGH